MKGERITNADNPWRVEVEHLGPLGRGTDGQGQERRIAVLLSES